MSLLEIVQMEKVVRTSIVLGFLLVSYGLGAPVSQVQDLDKRRESTPEILSLEQQLKKAAGEDKQYFSGAEGRPMLQIDGLSPDGQGEENPANEEQSLPDDVLGDIPVGEENLPVPVHTYAELWSIVKQHPDYMEDILQDYIGNAGQLNPGDYESPKREDEPLSAPDAPENIYVPSDAADRSDALMADYLAASEPHNQYPRPEESNSEASSEEDKDSSEEDKYSSEEEKDSSEEDMESSDVDDNEKDLEEKEHDDKVDEDHDEELEEDTEEDDDDEDADDDEGASVEDESDEDTEEEDDEEESDEDEESEEEEEELGSLKNEAKEDDESELGDDSAARELEDAVLEEKAKSSSRGQQRVPYKPWESIGDVVVPPMM